MLSGPVGLFAVVWGLLAWWHRGARSAAAMAAVGFVPTVAIAAIVAFFASQGYPPINDVATDPISPPQYELAPHRVYSESLARQVAKSYPEIQPLELRLAPGHVATLVERTVRQQGWTVTRAQALAVEGYATTGLFRFRDDFVIRVAAIPRGARIDMRSSSRVGQGDLGANAKRIVAFLSALERAAATTYN